jgi:hypothetical protein
MATSLGQRFNFNHMWTEQFTKSSSKSNAPLFRMVLGLALRAVAVGAVAVQAVAVGAGAVGAVAVQAVAVGAWQ